MALVKLDGYRALAVKSGAGVTLFSRRRKPLNRQFPYLVEALTSLREGTVVNGEVVAIDDSGRPDVNLKQAVHQNPACVPRLDSSNGCGQFRQLLDARCNTQGSPAVCDSPSPGTSWRNRESPAPLRVRAFTLVQPQRAQFVISPDVRYSRRSD